MSVEKMEDPQVLLPRLERRLLEPAVRNEPEEAGKLLAADFREFGSSGRVWSRSEILAELAAESPGRLEARNFEVTLLAADVALLTYRSARLCDGAPPRKALRSSLWRLEGGQWRVFFHQGTPIVESRFARATDTSESRDL